MPKQRRGGLGVVAESHGVANIGVRPNVIDDGRRSAFERREIELLLKDFHQQFWLSTVLSPAIESWRTPVDDLGITRNCA
jgi:hypothetical protein